jgi:hypothetical protein
MPGMAIRTGAALLAATTLATLGACAEDDSSSGGSSRAEMREAGLEFARCMRENGVDMPDPSPGGGLRLQARPDDDPAALERAQEKCRKHLEDVRPPEMSEEDRAEFRERALRFARCMREQGIDMPDPTFEGAGRVRMRAGANPEDPAFQTAQEKCERHQPRSPGAPEGP